MSTTNILDLNNRIDELEKNSGGGSADSAKRSDIATEFSTETSYTAGNFVYHDGKLYQFNADHSAGAWNPTDVVEANVTDQIVSNKAAIDGLTASDVAYDNTDSGLTAANVQNAVDELSESYPADKVILSDGVTNVEDRLEDSGWIQPTNKISYRKKNGFVTVIVSHTLSAADTWETAFTLPVGYRPSVDLFLPTYSSNTLYTAEGRVRTDGDISVIGRANATAILYTTFPVD